MRAQASVGTGRLVSLAVQDRQGPATAFLLFGASAAEPARLLAIDLDHLNGAQAIRGTDMLYPLRGVFGTPLLLSLPDGEVGLVARRLGGPVTLFSLAGRVVSSLPASEDLEPVAVATFGDAIHLLLADRAGNLELRFSHGAIGVGAMVRGSFGRRAEGPPGSGAAFFLHEGLPAVAWLDGPSSARWRTASDGWAHARPFIVGEGLTGVSAVWDDLLGYLAPPPRRRRCGC